MVDIDQDSPQLSHGVTHIFVLIEGQKENLGCQSHKIGLELLVEHDYIAQALGRTLDILEMTDTAMDLQKLIDKLLASKLIGN